MRVTSIRRFMTLALPTVLLLVGVAANAGTWSPELVDNTTSGRYGECSLALDGSWTPHVSYFYEGSLDLIYARRTDSGWETTTVASVGNAGYKNALALDSLGRPRICYRGEGVLMQAAWNGASWALEQVAGMDPAHGVSIAIDGNGYSHILSSNFYNLYHSWEDQYGWNTAAIYMTSGYVFAPCLAFNGAGDLRMSFSTADDLYYGRLDGGSWTFGQVDSTAGLDSALIGESCLAFDSNDNPGISYYKESQLDGFGLMFAELDGASWDITNVDGWKTGGNSSLAYDSLGRPHIAYSEPHPTWDVRYAAYDGSSWNLEIANLNHYGAGGLSMALDPEDTAHIAFANYGQLGYTKNGPGLAPDAAATDSPELASFGLLLLSAPLIGALRRRRT